MCEPSPDTKDHTHTNDNESEREEFEEGWCPSCDPPIDEIKTASEVVDRLMKSQHENANDHHAESEENGEHNAYSIRGFVVPKK